MYFCSSFQTAIECTSYLPGNLHLQTVRQLSTMETIKNRLLWWVSLLLIPSPKHAAASGANIAITFNICSCCCGSLNPIVFVSEAPQVREWANVKESSMWHWTEQPRFALSGKYHNILLVDTPGLWICSPRTEIQIPVYLSNRSPLGIKRILNSIRRSHANTFYSSSSPVFLRLLQHSLNEWNGTGKEKY